MICSGNLLFWTPFSSGLRLISGKVYEPVTTLCSLPLRGSGVRALRRDSRATKTEPRNRGGRTEKRKDLGERLERLWTQRSRRINRRNRRGERDRS